MTTATQIVENIENILRPLANRTIQCPECKGIGEIEVVGQGTAKNLCHHTTVLPCRRVILDPRFAALRTGNTIDASPGAILRAIQACGLEISLAFCPAPKGHKFLRDSWLATWPWKSSDTRHVYAETAEETLAWALAKAIGTEADGRH